VIGYYSPSEIIAFNRDQIMFILNFCLEGWPGRESSYTDGLASSGVNPRMPRETELLVLAEVSARLNSCGDAGRRLHGAFLGGDLMDAADTCPIAIQPRPKQDCPMALTCPQKGNPGDQCESKAVVNYICGVCRRNSSCGNCHSIKCKRRGRKPCTFSQWVNHNR
jgi:hypothetical protein